MSDEVVITGPAAIPTLIAANGGTVHEVRARFRRGVEAEVRVLVAFPTVEGSSAFRSAVTAHGGTLEGNPSGLANGHPLPLGFVVSFAMPAASGGSLLGLGP